jgi:hypothetical protein
MSASEMLAFKRVQYLTWTRCLCPWEASSAEDRKDQRSSRS